MTRRLVLVVDFGGQYSQLIVRRVRELGVYAELLPWTEAARLRERRPDAVILSGGPKSVREPGAPDLDFGLVEGIPVLGICYGQQLIAARLGGRVEAAQSREYGFRKLGGLVLEDGREEEVGAAAGSLVGGLESDQVWMSHGDQVLAPPPGFVVTACTESCPVAAFEDRERRMYGVQFHPEVSHTPSGRTILRRFLFERAGLAPDWTSESFIEEQLAAIRARVGDRKVLCAVSGGVDSSVMAALLMLAIGERAVCYFVDTGLLREGEAEQVRAAFQDHFGASLKVFDAADRFFGALAGLVDPEAKRKAVGETFVRVFEAHAAELAGCDFLAQGTLYPDVIESGSPTAAKIKSHHNVGGLPAWMKLELLEPLRWLFKDEVREAGRLLGLPAEMIERQPFPGPGLAVRVLGEVTPVRAARARHADAIFQAELRDRKLLGGVWQSYAALLDVKSVGVMGDERTYEEPIVLRAVESEDAMTARAAPLPFEALEAIAARIVNEVDGVNRVFYDLTSKPPATIELE